ncbi:PREDICTED: alpha-mannosidase 2-like [Acropora digitifera]|uniref:alpha-mannosidase 2-like n=1 Tax=Acropora digitifera TaxID=70779 RepID=UPI00077ACB33|nr:PREDICTED: alpha-mannosidase 2-like [Acropora digitifera]
MKKWIVLLGGGMFCVLFLSMYFVVDQLGRMPTSEEIRNVEMKRKFEVPLDELEKDMSRLESNLERSGKIMSNMQESVDKILFRGKKPNVAVKGQIPSSMARQPDEQAVGTDDGCVFSGTASGKSANVKMLDMFDIMPFDNIDGGAWKQGWDVQYDDKSFDEEPLNVFVVPHSHNDPGWIKTLDQYYSQQTRHILDNVVDALAEDKRRKFIWAEISYFSMWWSEADENRKKHALDQLSSGQLEIVTGGWVMNDEANTHYYAMLDQMIEGHQWMSKFLGSAIKPMSGWAIDPFGHTPTMAYLLKRMGFNSMLIQRTHYQVKKHLAKDKNLEFMWRQNWGGDGRGRIPDLAGYGRFWPNFFYRSKMLLDQYKKKAQLYRTNVLFAPLGDDFRYETTFDTHAQFTNYQRIMDYINSHPEMKAKVQFGTLSDYFNALFKATGTEPGGQPENFPALSGDFYTYADREDHYWSGYYTSRPFYKNLDRELESKHRAAEIIFSLAESHVRHRGSSSFPVEQLYGLLTKARQNLALFQHHDGITGTAKDFVVVDYGQRMLQSLNDVQSVIQESAQLLLTSDMAFYQPADPLIPPLKFEKYRPAHDALPTKEVITLSDTPRAVVFYNSLTTTREQVVGLHISDPEVMVSDSDGAEIASQVNVWWDHRNRISTAKYEVLFVAKVPALGLTTYFVSSGRGSKLSERATITAFNSQEPHNMGGNFKVESKIPGEENILLENDEVKLEFSGASGLLKTITHKKDGTVTEAAIDFATYGTKSSGDRSGAYLFLPDGPAVTHGKGEQPAVYVIRGKLMQEVRVSLPNVVHVVRLYSVPGPERRMVDIQNKVDIKNLVNKELVMRIKSSVKNSNREFYTDLNGFQMQKRKTLDKIPIQANFYPLPSMAFLQDKSTRLTLLSSQPNGVASLHQGEFQVVLDRRLYQDDNRGLGQGVTDNKETLANFRLLVEEFTTAHDGPVSMLYFELKGFIVTVVIVFFFSRQVELNHLFQDLFIDRLQSTSLTLLHEYQELDPSSPLNVKPMELSSYKMRLT